MDSRTRLTTAFDLLLPDRPPILGGWLAAPKTVQTLTGCSQDEYWHDPTEWTVKAEKALGSDGMITVIVPLDRSDFRIMDAHTLEERAHYQNLDMVLAEIAALPDPEEVRAAFNEEEAYAAFKTEYLEWQARCGDMLWVPADWNIFAVGLRYDRYGYENALTLPVLYPEAHSRMLHVEAERARQRAVVHARAIREGLQPKCFLTGEDLCSQQGPMVSPRLLRKEYWPLVEYAIEPLLEVGARLVWHCDGNVRPILNDVLACGFAGLQGFQRECGIDLEWIADLRTGAGDPLVIFGPMSVTTTLPYGSPEDVRAEVRRAMRLCRDKASLVFFTSNTINPDVPVENIRAYWDEVQSSRW